jgi:Domain of unknown function (DUF4082)
MAVYSIFGQTGGGTLQADNTGYTLGMQFSVDTPVPLTGIWWYSASGAGGLPTTCAIWTVLSATIVTGTENTSPSWSGAVGSGWVKCPYNGSVTLQANTSYMVTVYYAGGSHWYSGTSNYWASGNPGGSGIDSGPLNAPSAANSNVGQDSFHTEAFAFPNGNYQSSNYWVDVEVTTVSAGNGTLLAMFP